MHEAATSDMYQLYALLGDIEKRAMLLEYAAYGLLSSG